MAKVRDRVQSLEALEGQRTRLREMRIQIEGRVKALKERVDLGEARDAELFRQSLSGKDTVKERDREHEQTEEKQAALNREIGDLTIVTEELLRLEGEIIAAKHQGNLDRVAAFAEKRRAGLLAAAREIPVALASVVAQLEDLVAEWQAERQTRNNDLQQGFECPGEVGLQRLHYLVAELLHGARALQEGRPS